jgi:hypothetical protein
MSVISVSGAIIAGYSRVKRRRSRPRSPGQPGWAAAATPPMMRKREREAAPPRCDEDSAPWGEEAPQPRAPKLCKLKTVPLRPRNQMPRNSPLPPRDPASLAPSPALSHGGTRDSTGSSFVRCFCCNQSIAISSYNLHLDHECKGRGGGGDPPTHHHYHAPPPGTIASRDSLLSPVKLPRDERGWVGGGAGSGGSDCGGAAAAAAARDERPSASGGVSAAPTGPFDVAAASRAEGVDIVPAPRTGEVWIRDGWQLLCVVHVDSAADVPAGWHREVCCRAPALLLLLRCPAQLRGEGCVNLTHIPTLRPHPQVRVVRLFTGSQIWPWPRVRHALPFHVTTPPQPLPVLPL